MPPSPPTPITPLTRRPGLPLGKGAAAAGPLRIRLHLADLEEQARLHAYLVGQGHVASLATSPPGGEDTAADIAADAFLVRVMDWPPRPGDMGPMARPGTATVCLCDPAPGRRAAALEAGADDCLSRPYEARELLARLSAVRRRSQRPPRAAGDAPARRQGFGDWRMDAHSRRLVHTSGRDVTLTEAEWRLLRIFLQRPRLALAREHLQALTQGATSEITDPPPAIVDRNVDLLVSRLRHKLADTAARPSYIHTIRGVGYLFDAFEV
jgi:DNA-binding response OmpR family regulator